MRALPSLLVLVLLGLQPAIALSQAQHDEHSEPTAQASHSHDQDHAAEHAGHAPARTPAAPPGARWQADAALTRGMQQLRELSHALQSLPADPEPTAVAALGEQVEATVHMLFAECRLEPEPDAALHALLAQVLGARRQLGTEDTDPAAAQATLEQVLHEYAERFVDRH